MGTLFLLISVALALPHVPRAGTLGQSLAPETGTLAEGDSLGWPQLSNGAGLFLGKTGRIFTSFSP